MNKTNQHSADTDITTLTTRDDAITYLDRHDVASALKEIEKHFVDQKTVFEKNEIVLNPLCDVPNELKDAMSDEGNKRNIAKRCTPKESEQPKDTIEKLRRYYAIEPDPWKGERYDTKITFDCDACKTARIAPEGVVNMYELLWSNIMQLSEKDRGISADTMNSFFGLYQNYTHAPMWSRKAMDSEKIKKAAEEEGQTGEEELKQFKLFAYLTHTAGNFILCYGSFNRDRRSLTKDLWDLTLECIRKWYLDPRQVSQTSGNLLNMGPLDQCSPWLNSFEGKTGEERWANFVSKNLLAPYMEGKAGDTEIRSLIDDHYLYKGENPISAESGLYPEKSKMAEFVKNINACIIARGNLIRKEFRDIAEGKKEDKSEEERAKAKRALKLLFAE